MRNDKPNIDTIEAIAREIDSLVADMYEQAARFQREHTDVAAVRGAMLCFADLMKIHTARLTALSNQGEGECIDLKHISYDQMAQAASESKWMPPEYVSNDWIADCCDFLRNGHPTPAAEAYRRDAERYRWLRNASGANLVVTDDPSKVPRYLGPICWEYLDREIDAEIQEQT